MNYEALHKEISYRTSRSSGAGGQHVNKVSTKVELLFNIYESELFTDEQKEIIIQKLRHRITNKGFLSMQCDRTRSQLKNKEIVFERLVELLKEALTPVKKRKPSKPGKAAIEKRLSEKKRRSQKKDLRRFKSGKE